MQFKSESALFWIVDLTYVEIIPAPERKALDVKSSLALHIDWIT